MLILAETDVTLIQGLPVEAHVALAAAFIAGLVLWAAGAKVLKPMFALLGLLVGAFSGLIISGALDLGSIAGVGGWLIAMVVGAIIGLVATLALLKTAIVFVAAATFALVGYGGGMIYVQATGGPANPVEPPPPSETTARDDSGALLFEDPRTGSLVPIARLLSDDDIDVSPEDVERARVIATRVTAVVRSSADLALRRWNALGPDQKTAVAGATLGGLALGLAAGFFLPKRSTAVITALAGSASFLIAGVSLIEGLPWLAAARPYVDQTPIAWAIIWSITAAAGLLVQLNLISKNKRGNNKKKSKDNDD